jgi:nitrate reductase gamma subunit
VTAAVFLVSGLAILGARRIVFRDRLRLVTTRWDKVMYVLVAAVVTCGVWPTVQLNVLGAGYDYRATVSIWFRSVFLLQPETSLMAAAPLGYQCHVILAFGLFAIWPFTRLVHVWSVPLGYLARPLVVYRSAASAKNPTGR